MINSQCPTYSRA